MTSDNILDIVEEPGPDVTQRNILKHIWLFPTNTLQYILRQMPEKHRNLIYMLAGIVNALNRATNQNLGDNQDILLVMVSVVFFGALSGFVTYNISAWLLQKCGEWLGGKASFSEFKTIVAWSLVPVLCGFLLFIVKYIFFGKELFLSEMEVEKLSYSIGLVVFGILEIVLGLWSVFILIRGVSLIQSFILRKAIYNVFLPLIIIAIIGLLCFVWISLFR